MNPVQNELLVDVKKGETVPEWAPANGEGQVTAPADKSATETETPISESKKPQDNDDDDNNNNGNNGIGKDQTQDKQSAATSLLAQLLGNAQQPAAAAPSTPDNLPQTPLPEPLTDVSTPVAPHDESSRNETAAAAEPHAMPEVQNGTADPVAEETMDSIAHGTGESALEENPDANILEDPTRIPDMVSGVMEDPLSKSAHEHNGLFPPFDPGAGVKNALDSLHQHDMLGSAFLAHELNMSGLPVSGIPDLSDYANPFNEVAASIAGSEPRIQAFAKLEFDDGHFYVNTYSFVLGRDVRAARAAHQRDMQVRQVMGRPSKNKSSSGGNTSHTPNRVKRDGSAYMGSVVSDRGGIMGFDPDIPHMNQKSRRSSLSSQPESALATPAQLQANHTDYNALAMQSLHDGGGDAKPVDALALLPSPDACPTIPIHPPATTDGMAAGHKGISRKHVKISYNFDKSLFEMEVMGRNGAFIGADWLAPGQVRPLHSGDYIQIGGVRIRFLLPDVPIGETGADRMEDTLMEEDGTLLIDADNDMTGEIDAMDLSDIDSADETQQSRITKLILKTKNSGDSPNPPTATSVDGNSEAQPRRRGPGRPPKDGIMSKRERAEIAREQKMAAKREANGGVTPPPSNRIKPPKPRKEDSVEEPPSAIKQPEKRKFTKRKQPDGTFIDVPIDSIEGGEPLPPEQVVEYPKPPPKKRKPSRSPSPDYPPESSYTQDQLAKPPYNYAVLIFDALTEARAPMTLKQIYRALKLKYPYFRFKCETEGWTSSVRHNLNGNRQLFEHAERDGKGWSWQLRAGASVEKEKKRRPSPPPPSTHLSQPPSHQHYVPPTNNHYANQGVPNQQQFQFSSMTPTHYNAPPPPVPQPNTYRPPPPPPAPAPAPAAAPAPNPAAAPPPQSSLPAPLRSTNLPGSFSQPGSSSYVSPYPCPLPSEIVQLQQSQQPQPQQQGMQQQRSSESIPPPRQDQQTQPQQSHQPIHQQQPPQPQQHQHYPSFSPPNPSPSPYPLPNNQVHHAPPQQAQPPPPLPQQGPQPMHNQQQTYPNPNASPMPSGPPPASNHQRPMNQADEPESSASFMERANKAIDDFEAVLMEDYDDKDYIREVLKSARARAWGHAKESSFPDGEPKDEAVLLDALLNLIEGLRGSNTS
jgi:hypothetical protein